LVLGSIEVPRWSVQPAAFERDSFLWIDGYRQSTGDQFYRSVIMRSSFSSRRALPRKGGAVTLHACLISAHGTVAASEISIRDMTSPTPGAVASSPGASTALAKRGLAGSNPPSPLLKAGLLGIKSASSPLVRKNPLCFKCTQRNALFLPGVVSNQYSFLRIAVQRLGVEALIGFVACRRPRAPTWH
jgi:hypothetical protein